MIFTTTNGSLMICAAKPSFIVEGVNYLPTIASLRHSGNSCCFLKVCDVAQGGRVSSRAIIMQQKTHRPVQFEITEQTRDSLANWISQAQLKSDESFPKPNSWFAALFDAAICSNSWALGDIDWSWSGSIRNAHDAPDKSDFDLQTDKKLACRSTVIGSY